MLNLQLKNSIIAVFIAALLLTLNKFFMKLKVLNVPQNMRNDSQGLGHFGSPRGVRTHEGTDIIALPNSNVIAPFNGVITKYGYTSQDNLALRYIELQHGLFSFIKIRLHYVTKLDSISVGQNLNKGALLGVVQNMSYNADMINHIHSEIIVYNQKINSDKYYV